MRPPRYRSLDLAMATHATSVATTVTAATTGGKTHARGSILLMTDTASVRPSLSSSKSTYDLPIRSQDHLRFGDAAIQAVEGKVFQHARVRVSALETAVGSVQSLQTPRETSDHLDAARRAARVVFRRGPRRQVVPLLPISVADPQNTLGLNQTRGRSLAHNATSTPLTLVNER